MAMGLNNDLVEYDLHDVDSGQTYKIFISKTEADLLDLDHMSRHRKVQDLKRDLINPTSKWVDDSEVRVDEAAGSLWEPSPAGPSKPCDKMKPKGKKGAVWGEKNTTAFLNCALPYRMDLRKFRVPAKVYGEIAHTMSQNDKDSVYDPEQLREKIRNMKRTYSEAKKGQHKGERWPHFWLMCYLYDEDVGLSTSVALTNERDRNKSFGVPGPSRSSHIWTPLLSSTLQPAAAEMSGAADHPETTLNISNISAVAPVTICKTVITNANEVQVQDNDNDYEQGEAEVMEPEQNNNPLHLNGMEVIVPVQDDNDLQLLRSPCKKKPKAASVPIGIRQSPLTPKRKKAAKAALVWPPEMTFAFLAECKKRKDGILKERVPLATWKAVSEGLNGFDGITWQLCRDKFCQMNKYFIDTILPEKGFLGESVWAYYEDFCDLHDIPEDFNEIVGHESDGEDEEDDNEVVNDNGPTTGKGKLWKDDENVFLLIDHCKVKMNLFESAKSGLKHLYLFSQIASELKKCGMSVTGKQCQSKMQRLRDEYRVEFDKENKTGAAPSSWKFFTKMNELDGGKANMVAPVSVSVGRGLQYTRSDLDVRQQSENRGTRTRMSQENSRKEKTPRVPIYKSRPQEIQIRNVEARERIAASIERMEKKFDEKSETRMSMLQRLEQKMDRLLKD